MATQHHVHVTGTSKVSGTTHGVAVVYTHVTGVSGAMPIVALASEATCRYINFAQVPAFINVSVSWWRNSGVSRVVVLNVVIPTVMMI